MRWYMDPGPCFVYVWLGLQKDKFGQRVFKTYSFVWRNCIKRITILVINIQGETHYSEHFLNTP